MIYILNFKTFFKSEKEHLNYLKRLTKLKTKDKIWLAFNPYFYLCLRQKIKVSKFEIGLQNLGFITNKPQTGEIIYDFELINRAKFILLGHSERYRLGENLDILRKKIETLQDKNFKLVIFFSENSYEPKERFEEVKIGIEKNLQFILSSIRRKNFSKVYLVYEPWWAISTERGKIPTRKFLDNFLNWYFNKYQFPILYGGSFNSKLKKEYQGLKFQGYVLGKVSIDFNELSMILS